jgi:tripartite ATP-independent transporter DctM subunit
MIVLMVLALVFFGAAMLAMPIAIAMGLGSAVVAAGWDIPGFLIAQKTLNGDDSFTLLAIPFFMLAARIMNAGGITPRVVDVFANAAGRIRGSSALVNVGANIFLAGISGSSVADCAATGSLLIPEMKREGYSGGFAAAFTSGCALLGGICGPAIALIIYGIVAQVSITRLLLAGYLPGLLLAATLGSYVMSVAYKKKIPARGRAKSWGVIGQSFLKSGWAISTPLLLIVGIRTGVFTVTELGAVLVLYAIFVGWLIHRELKWKEIPNMLVEAGLQTANVMLVVGVSSFIAYLIVIFGVPDTLQAVLHGANMNRVEFLLLVNLVFLVAGMFLDSTPATLILVPIFLPAAVSFGVDPIHFGLVICLNLMIGLIHPPLGLNLLITRQIAQVPMKEVIWESLPIVGLLLLVLAIITFVPEVALWLPNKLGVT